ncbi:hypothetical protein CMUST_14490 [Corynebacterium mustelae]|uniref:Phenazine antibiotic biosynthesis protein n=1 Tax=Corynebacterium mustelae TaxID=571915 RepID=A0A0G3H1C6_9CORY|nr:hypothetical protein [Corynebacterium mustelae]AKK07191.1 hypothetical protein CMUST_14490 [Corynebacterium mustelae]
MKTYADHVHKMVDWHTSDSTGSKYWISRKLSGWSRELIVKWFLDGVPPKGFSELEKDFRTRPIEDFIPSGIAKTKIAGFFESGGTTGVPKRVILGEEWANELIDWSASRMLEWGHHPGRNWLVSVPTGPHVVGELSIRGARKEGAQAFRIDVDPRWAKNAASYGGNVDGYSQHLIDQMKNVLLTQDVGCIITTPPILQNLVRDNQLVDVINENHISIRWGGMPFDNESEMFMRDVIFPRLPFFGVLGNTMTLGFGVEVPVDLSSKKTEQWFSFHAPFTKLFICGEDEDAFWETGEGRLAYAHASKTHLYPPMPDRDFGIIAADGLVSLSNQQIVAKENFINGVY